MKGLHKRSSFSQNEREKLYPQSSPLSPLKKDSFTRTVPIEENTHLTFRWDSDQPSLMAAGPLQNQQTVKSNFHSMLSKQEEHEDLQRVCMRQDSFILSDLDSKCSNRGEDIRPDQALDTNINSQLQSFEETDDLRKLGIPKANKNSRMNFSSQQHDSTTALNKRKASTNQDAQQKININNFDNSQFDITKRPMNSNVQLGYVSQNTLNPTQQVQDRFLQDMQVASRKDNDEATQKETNYARRSEVKKVVQGSFKMITLILPKMRRFLSTKTLIGRQKMLSQQVHSFINDQSDFYYHSYRKKVQFPYNYIGRLVQMAEALCSILRLDRIPLFDPENLLKLLVNSIIVAYNCFYLFVVSVEVVFSAHFAGATIFHYIAQAAWITELLLQMNTATYHHNTFTTDRKIILRIYAKEYLLFEILPLLFEGRQSDNITINILLHLPLLLKIKGIMIIIKKIEFYALQILEKHYILFLFQLCMKVFIFGHIIACTRRLVSEFEVHFLGIEQTWLANSTEAEHQWITEYLECLYWSFAIMMHNLSEKPVNDIEFAYSCLTMLLTSIVFGFMLNSIGSILADISRQHEDYKKDLNVLSTYMKRKKIDLSIRRRVNSNLLRYYHQQSRDKIMLEKEAMKKLPLYMQNELLTSSNEKILKLFPVFTDQFSPQTISAIYSIMDEVVYAPNQVIFRAQSAYEDSIFLILKGEAKMTTPLKKSSNKRVISILLSYHFCQTYKRSNEMEQSPFRLSSKQNYLPGQTTWASQQQQLQQQQGVSNERTMKKLILLKAGDCMGLYSFFAGQDKQMNAMSNTFTTIIKINRNQFIDIVRTNRADFEKFMEIRDKVLFDQKYKVVKNLECTICNSPDHLISQCNRVYFDKQNSYIYHRYNFSPLQPRDDYYTRRSHRFKTSTANQKAFFDRIFDIQRDNDMLDSSMMDETFDSESNDSESSEGSSLKGLTPPLKNQSAHGQTHAHPQTSSMTNIGQQRVPSSLHNGDDAGMKKRRKKNQSVSAMKSNDHNEIYTIVSESQGEDASHVQSRSYAFSKFTEKDVNSEMEVEENVVTTHRRKSLAQIAVSQHSRRGSHLRKAPSDLEQILNSPKASHGIEIAKGNITPLMAGTMDDKVKGMHSRDIRAAISQSSLQDDKNQQQTQLSTHLQMLMTTNSKQYLQQIQQQQHQQVLQNNVMTSQILKKLAHQQSEAEIAIAAQDYFEWRMERIQEFTHYYTLFNITNIIRKTNAFNNTKINKKRKFTRQKSKGRTHFNNSVMSKIKPQTSIALLDMRSGAGGLAEPRSFIISKGPNSNLSISRVSMQD